jgi:hypothetical protein
MALCAALGKAGFAPPTRHGRVCVRRRAVHPSPRLRRGDHAASAGAFVDQGAAPEPDTAQAVGPGLRCSCSPRHVVPVPFNPGVRVQRPLDNVVDTSDIRRAV